MKLFQLMVPGLEIVIIAIMLYYLLSFFWNTLAMDLLFGISTFFMFFVISSLFQLPVLHKLMLYFVNVAVIALIIIF